MYKKLLFIASLLAFTMSVKAGDTLRYTLEQCHEFALQNSATARLQSEEVQAAKYGRQAALAAMFPRVSANGGYMWNSRNAHLVGDEHSVGSLGTARIDKDGNPSFDWSSTSWISQQAAQWAGTILEGPIKAIQGGVGNFIAGGYQKLYDALTIDVQHILVAQVGITQPIYLGGRLTQMYNFYDRTGQMEYEFEKSASGIVLKPANITGKRRAQGRIQDELGNLLAAYANFKVWLSVIAPMKRHEVAPMLMNSGSSLKKA